MITNERGKRIKFLSMNKHLIIAIEKCKKYNWIQDTKYNTTSEQESEESSYGRVKHVKVLLMNKISTLVI